ncbi:hypothetical protein DL93DRAFT_615970 [Clavulina sp. PMI_390]|nr:hypothetical protein DL93DRAFT_615970 [Clavulina sp. PMI_390]
MMQSPPPRYPRPPTRFEHRTSSNTSSSRRMTTSTGTGAKVSRSPAELMRSWEAFDRLFEDAFAPVKYADTMTGASYSQRAPSQYTNDDELYEDQGTELGYDAPDVDEEQERRSQRSRTPSPRQRSTVAPESTIGDGFRTPRAYTQTGRTYLYEETPSQMGRTHRPLYADDDTEADGASLAPSRTGKTHLYEETPARTFSELSDLFEDADPSVMGTIPDDRSQTYTRGYTSARGVASTRAPESFASETPMQTPQRLPGSFPSKTYNHSRRHDTPYVRQSSLPREQSYEKEKSPAPAPRLAPPAFGGKRDSLLETSSADEDFARLWAEAEQNRRKRMTRTVTRRRILQHGVMSPTASVGTIATTTSAAPQGTGQLQKHQPAEPEHKLKKKKSRFHLYRNGDADYMTATFDLPDVRKEDVHVAFQSSQLTITWESTLVTERRADDRTIIRERKERKYARTLPLPPGTDFADVKAYLENGVLTVMYPKFSMASKPRAVMA